MAEIEFNPKDFPIRETNTAWGILKEQKNALERAVLGDSMYNPLVVTIDKGVVNVFAKFELKDTSNAQLVATARKMAANIPSDMIAVCTDVFVRADGDPLVCTPEQLMELVSSGSDEIVNMLGVVLCARGGKPVTVGCEYTLADKIVTWGEESLYAEHDSVSDGVRKAMAQPHISETVRGTDWERLDDETLYAYAVGATMKQLAEINPTAVMGMAAETPRIRELLQETLKSVGAHKIKAATAPRQGVTTVADQFG